eukprot:c19943_g1_i3 orf=285-1181(-)
MISFSLPVVPLFLITFVSQSPCLSLAWGTEGHYITCLLAESLFSQPTLEAVQDLLPAYAEGSLASLCSWPDQVRRRWQWHWSGPLHFIDTPDFQCSYKYSRDCHDAHGNKDMCSAGAINNFTSQLTTYGSSDSPYNLTEALLFLSHIVGDIHQPLHVGYTGDEGGNTILVHWYRRKTNLHHIWDDEFIETAKKRYYDGNLQGLVDALSRNLSEKWNEASNWGSCHAAQIACPDTYAKESIKAACRWAYKDVEQDSTLQDEYFLSRLPIVEERLLHGGVRLGAILNKIFDKEFISLTPN